MLILALAFLLPLKLQEPSVYAIMSGGLCVLGSCLADSSLHLAGLVNIQKFLWIVPIVVMSGLKILILFGGPIALLVITALSSSVILLVSGCIRKHWGEGNRAMR